jgi:ubiquinone/menaquinone biosynthesis C-methylase UbiE
VKGVRRDPERVEIQRLRRAAPIAGARVIELGGGEGRLTRRLAAVAGDVVSIDPNPASITHARRLFSKQLRNVRFVVGSAESLRLGDERFDVAVLSWSL